MRNLPQKKQRNIVLGLFFAMLLSIGVLCVYRWDNIHSLVTRTTTGVATTEPGVVVPSTDYSAEMRELNNHISDWGFKEVQEYFKSLSEHKGAEFAYEVLKRAPLPPNMDLHLLGHVVGNILYKQEGVDGMRICTQDFRNACSHAIVVGLFNDEGEAALGKIVHACRKAPGGSGAYTMCFHGLGHGVFAALGYDVAKTVAVCAKAGTTPGSGSPEAVECVGGMVMELMGGGDHDRDLWAKKRAEYVSDAKPLRPCSDSVIPKEAKYICYVYITPHLFQVAGADLGHPLPEHFKKAFTYCDTLPSDDKSDRDACFGGFGKEFTVLVQDRDIRQQSLLHITDAQLKTVYTWCKLTSNKDGSAACIISAMNSLYWGSENPDSLPIRFCNQIGDNEYLYGSCYMAFFAAANQYARETEKREAVCAHVPDRWRSTCKTQLSLSGQ